MTDETRDDRREERGLALPGDEGDPHEPEIEIVGYGDDEDERAEDAAEAGELARLRAELDELEQRHVRLRADFENARKRHEREHAERARRALAEPLRELLPVIDNLERALAAPGTVEELRDGVELIARQFAEVLKRFGLSEIPALGLPFDPEVHEAVAREEDPSVAAPTVIAELQRGYWLNDRLLRPAMVRVAVPPEGDEAAESRPSGALAGDRDHA